MKHSFILLFIAIVVITTASQCKKPKSPDTGDGLPPATQTGANIFACKVNGVNWISNNDIYHLGGGIKNDTLGVTGSPKTVGYFESMGIQIKGNLQEGSSYSFTTSNNIFDFMTNKTCLGYLGSAVITAFAINGNMILTKLDRTNKIISGLFNCIIPIPNCDTLKITEGRFDIKYY